MPLETGRELFWHYAFVACESNPSRTPREVFERHRLKGDFERHFSEVLTDLDLHHPPCLALNANRMFYAIASLAHNLLQGLKLLRLDDGQQSWRNRTIIRNVLVVPATLVATPDEGFAFTHWSNDAVGVEPQVTIIMDMNKTVTAHFIPEDAAERLAAEKAAQGGFYTREQMMALAMGDTVIEVDPEDGAIDLSIQLQESADLSSGDWSGVDASDGTVSVDGEGRVHIKMPPKGNTAFYRLVNSGAE